MCVKWGGGAMSYAAMPLFRLKAHKGNLREWLKNRVTPPLPLHNAIYYNMCVCVCVSSYNIIPDEACLPKQMFLLSLAHKMKYTGNKDKSRVVWNGKMRIDVWKHAYYLHFCWMLVSSIPIELIYSRTRTAHPENFVIRRVARFAHLTSTNRGKIGLCIVVALFWNA